MKTMDLDDPKQYGALDADGMIDRLHEFPGECGRALGMARGFALSDKLRDVDKVVVLGMGGSAIGGDLVASLAEAEARVPMQVYRGYHLPAYVDVRTLVIACSYSGNTEETLTCFQEGLARGAKSLAITTGGKLREMARANDVPAFVYGYKSAPRAALPYGFISLLCFMQRLGFIDKSAAGVDDVSGFLRSYAEGIKEGSPEARNVAKQAARFLHNKLAVIYGAELLSEVAHRWKTQLNENGKAWAVYETLPEMNHNSVVGYEFPKDLARHIAVVMLDSRFLSERIRVRYEVVRRLLTKAGTAFKTVAGEGSSAVAQMLSLVLLGDYTSYYLAMLNGTEPGPVHAIDYLKAELAKIPGK